MPSTIVGLAVRATSIVARTATTGGETGLVRAVTASRPDKLRSVIHMHQDQKIRR